MLRKKIGLALSGGGARGFAHIGVLKALVENNIPIDMIAGTSAGSVVGAALAAGMSPAEIEAMAKKVGWLNILRPSFSPRGLLSIAPLGKFLKRELPVARFEELRIPLAVVACDLVRREPVIFKDRGDLAHAVRASCAVPGVFTPLIDDDGRVLVDGGVIYPIPVNIASEMGADIVIAVDLLACGSTVRIWPPFTFGIAFHSVMALLRSASRDQIPSADIVIEPQIAHVRQDQISKRDELIQLGEQAALARLDELKALTLK